MFPFFVFVFFVFCWVAIDVISNNGCNSFCLIVLFLCVVYVCCWVAIDFITNNGCNSGFKVLFFLCCSCCLCLFSFIFLFVLLFLFCVYFCVFFLAELLLIWLTIMAVTQFGRVAFDFINTNGCNSCVVCFCSFVFHCFIMFGWVAIDFISN